MATQPSTVSESLALATYEVHGNDPTHIDERPLVTSPEAGAEIIVPLLDGLDREVCLALMLDVRHRLIAIETISVGSVDHTFMTPREIFKAALQHGAAALVVAHNHPSGDPNPSRDDERVTKRIMEAGDIIGIQLLDHMVVGRQSWVSLARRGHLG